MLDYISIFIRLWNFTGLFEYTPLICASQNGHIEIVQLLLAQPTIEINSKTI